MLPVSHHSAVAVEANPKRNRARRGKVFIAGRMQLGASQKLMRRKNDRQRFYTFLVRMQIFFGGLGTFCIAKSTANTLTNCSH